jgi:hypothetical protein
MGQLRTSLWTLAAANLAAAGMIAVMTPACDDEPEGECSIEEGTGCANGQECLLGADDQTHCACSVDADTGCAGGQQCLEGPDGEPACYCNTTTEGGCEAGLVCEEVVGGYPACFAPVTLGGMVFDLATDAAIEGALVVARDANFAAVSGVAVTDASAAMSSPCPSPQRRRIAQRGAWCSSAPTPRRTSPSPWRLEWPCPSTCHRPPATRSTWSRPRPTSG